MKNKLSVAQRKRLESLAEQPAPEPRVVAWSDKYRGPVLAFVTGNRCAVTKDGGLQPVG